MFKKAQENINLDSCTSSSDTSNDEDDENNDNADNLIKCKSSKSKNIKQKHITKTSKISSPKAFHNTTRRLPSFIRFGKYLIETWYSAP